MGLKFNPITGKFDLVSRSSGGSGKPFATLVVAASNALNTSGADYVCDGVDDDVTIETAIAALPAGGGRVVLTEGLFRPGSAIDLVKSNVTISGQGTATDIKLADAIDDNVIVVGDSSSNYNDIVLENFLVDGNTVGQVTGQGHGIYISGKTANTIVSRCTIQNTNRSNIYVAASTASYVRLLHNYCDTVKVGSNFANIEGGGNYLLLEGNVCLAGDYGALDLYIGSDHQVLNNFCFACNTGETITEFEERSLIQGNYVETNTGKSFNGGIYCSTGEGSIISNNTVIVQTAGVCGIYQQSYQGVVDGNFIEFNSTVNFSSSPTTSGQQFGAIYCDNARASITNNVAYIQSGSGDQMPVITSYDTSVVNNNSVDAQDSSRKIWGIMCLNSLTILNGNFIEGNDISADIGIWTLAISGVVSNNLILSCFSAIKCSQGDESGQIIGNVIESCYRGIDIQVKAVGFQIIGNFLQGNGSGTGNEGITIGAATGATNVSSENTISGNTIQEFAKEGIKMLNASRNSITGNVIRNVGQETNDTFAGILVKAGGADSTYNIFNANIITSSVANKPKYGIREDDANQGPNIVTSNIALNAVTAQISLQHGSSIDANNIVV